MPRLWAKWNFKALEPKDMRKDEQIKQDASKGRVGELSCEGILHQKRYSEEASVA